jgi:hypothetical protein
LDANKIISLEHHMQRAVDVNSNEVSFNIATVFVLHLLKSSKYQSSIRFIYAATPSAGDTDSFI